MLVLLTGHGWRVHLMLPMLLMLLRLLLLHMWLRMCRSSVGVVVLLVLTRLVRRCLVVHRRDLLLRLRGLHGRDWVLAGRLRCLVLPKEFGC